MTDDKINISWDELKTSKVEKQVKQQQAMARNRRYAKMTAADLPEADVTPGKRSIWYNEVFCLAIFGLVGGLLAWGCSALMHLRPDPRAEAEDAIRYVQQIEGSIRQGPGTEGITREQADASIASIARAAGDNPYVQIYLDANLRPAEKQQKRAALDRTQEWNNLLANVIAYGLCGLLVSVALSIAEPVVDHNIPASVINGSVGALLGLVGGLAASILVDRVYRAVGGGDNPNSIRHFAARAASWAILGCFISIAPGVVARNCRRLLIGVAGGAIGGIIGGLLLGPVARLTSSSEVGRLVALISIGVIAGVATGIIEQAARTGWLKVTSGLISGKQFILYRNPTYIGSSPDSQIYLFRDPKVGKRHAAVHVLKGRFEIENLPLGDSTQVNGEPITRRRLRNGDRIKIGATSFVFQEKEKGV